MEILPINAIVYNKEKVDINEVVAPPYDVIDEDYQAKLYERSPYNIVRIILSKEKDKYESAKNLFNEWKRDDILVSFEKPVIFYLVQRYKDEKGKQIERKGFIARNRIEDFLTKRVLPHENTMGAPKQDRFNLVTSTEAFFSQIFMVYKDDKQKIEKLVAEKYLQNEPYIKVTDDLGIENVVYIIDDDRDIEAIAKVMEDKTLLIADGHHRYETAMNYSRLQPHNEYAKFVMSYFTNAADENLVIYPTHRILEKFFTSVDILSAVKKYYDVEILSDKDKFLSKIEQENKKQIATGLIIKGDENFYVLKLKKGKEILINAPKVLRKLDLTALHELILKNELGYTEEELLAQYGIKYEKKEDVAFDSINGKASACFIMAHPKMEDIMEVADRGQRMPQKSTYFYPKLLSGLVINPLN